MAKMFYTLDEASDRLGVDQDAVKAMAADGKLQQFRDRDKLMFKREQVDSMAASGGSMGGGDGSSIGIPLADSRGPGDTDAISLSDSMGTEVGMDNPNEGTGISVFDAGEVEPADPMAQTQVTQPSIDDEELALESVGSGSGLLDLTRESDDTSLGAELLDEIYPGGGDTGAGATGTGTGDFGLESSIGASGVFEGSMSMDTGAAGASGIQTLSETDPGSMDAPVTTAGGSVVGGPAMTYSTVEEYDPAGSALGTGLLIGAMAALVIGLIVTVAAVAGTRSVLVSTLVTDSSLTNVLFLCVGLAVLSGVLGVVGYMIGKKSA